MEVHLTFVQRRMYYTVSVAILLLGLGGLLVVLVDLAKPDSPLRGTFFRPFRLLFVGHLAFGLVFFILHVRSLYASTGNPDFMVTDEDCGTVVVLILTMASTVNMFGVEYFWYDLRNQLRSDFGSKGFLKHMVLVMGCGLAWGLTATALKDMGSFEGAYCFSAEPRSVSRLIVTVIASTSAILTGLYIRDCYKITTKIMDSRAKVQAEVENTAKILQEIRKIGVASTTIHVLSWLPFVLLVLVEFAGGKIPGLVLIAGWAAKLQIFLNVLLVFSSNAYRNAKRKAAMPKNAVEEFQYVAMTDQEREEARQEIGKKLVFTVVESADVVVDLVNFIVITAQTGFTIGFDGALFTINFAISFLVGFLAVFAAANQVRGILREMKHGIPVQIARVRILRRDSTTNVSTSADKQDLEESNNIQRNLLELTMKRLEREKYEYKVLIALAFMEDFITFCFAFYRLFFTFYMFDVDFGKCLADGVTLGLISYPMDCFTSQLTLTLLQLVISFAVFSLKISFIKDIYRVSAKLVRTKRELEVIHKSDTSVLDKFHDVSGKEVSRVVELRKAVQEDGLDVACDVWLLYFLRKAKMDLFSANRLYSEWMMARDKYGAQKQREQVIVDNLSWSRVCKSNILESLGVELKELCPEKASNGEGISCKYLLRLKSKETLLKKDHETWRKQLESAIISVLERAMVLLEHASLETSTCRYTITLLVDTGEQEKESGNWIQPVVIAQSLWTIAQTYPLDIHVVLWKPPQELTAFVHQAKIFAANTLDELNEYVPRDCLPFYMSGVETWCSKTERENASGRRMSDILGAESVLKAFPEVSHEDYSSIRKVAKKVHELFYAAMALQETGELIPALSALEKEAHTKLYFSSSRENAELLEMDAKTEMMQAVKAGLRMNEASRRLVTGVQLLRAYRSAGDRPAKCCHLICKMLRIRSQWGLEDLHEEIYSKRLSTLDMSALKSIQQFWPCTPIAGFDKARAELLCVGMYASRVKVSHFRQMPPDQVLRGILELAECVAIVAEKASLSMRKLVRVRIVNVMDNVVTGVFGMQSRRMISSWIMATQANIGLVDPRYLAITKFPPQVASFSAKLNAWRNHNERLQTFTYVSMHGLERYVSLEAFRFPPKLDLATLADGCDGPEGSTPIIEVFDTFL